MLQKTKLIQGDKIVTVTISPEVVFRRALTLSGTRPGVSMTEVLKHPITSVPSSLFHEDGSMRKTNKSILAHKLEEKVTSKAQLLSYQRDMSVYIRDASSELHKLQVKDCKTFNQAAARYYQALEKGFIHSNTIIDVFDQYPTNSIKEAERQRRGKSNNKVYQVIGGRSVPPWDKFMATSDNKKAISDFISSFICEYRYTR